MRAWVLVLLCVEFVDELWDGVLTAAWPWVTQALGFTPLEVGWLLGLPVVLGNAVEPWVGVAGEAWGRRRVALAGGVGVVCALALAATANGFWSLLAALTLFYPSSGALVGLSELDLVEQEGAHRSRWMMVWVAVGCAGALVGPLWLLLAVGCGGTWRAATWGVVLAAAACVVALWRLPEPPQSDTPEEAADAADVAEASALSLGGAWRLVWASLQDPRVWRASGLLLVADLMLDTWVSFWVLFAVDVARLSEAEAALGVAVFIGAILVSNAALARWLEGDDRAEQRWLRGSAAAAFAVAWALIAARGVPLTYTLLALLGALVAGWYPILKGRFYALFAGRGGVALAVHAVGSTLGGLQTILIGWLAAALHLTAALAVLTLGAAIIFAARKPPATPPAVKEP